MLPGNSCASGSSLYFPLSPVRSHLFFLSSPQNKEVCSAGSKSQTILMPVESKMKKKEKIYNGIFIFQLLEAKNEHFVQHL